METKLCKVCGEEKVLSKMVRHPNTKDGYLYKCKACRLIYYQSRRHSVVVSNKICRTCGATKSSSEFHKNPRAADGLHSQCGDCTNKCKKDAEYWRTSNEILKERRQKDPVFRKHLRKLKRKSSYRNRESVLVSNARNRAKKYNLEFNLTKEDIIIPTICPILNKPIVIGTKGNYEWTASIDRIDNSKGYTKNNIQIISKKANSMKNSATKEELLDFANWIYTTYNKKISLT